MMKNICIVSNGYPTKENPVYAFIKPVACAMADAGLDCVVIAPQSVTSSIMNRRALRPTHWEDYTETGNKITIYQPIFFSFSNIKLLGRSLSRVCFDRAALRAYKRMKEKPDVLYGHFWECAITAAKLDVCPVIAVTGESIIPVFNYYSENDIKNALERVIGVISVSSENLKQSIQLGLMKEYTKHIILPNGYNPDDFYVMDKMKVRKEIGYNEDEFIGAFVGEFCDRKGSERVLEAIRQISDCKMLFIGKGNLSDSPQILFKGRLSHESIVKYLNAADFFVLPTRAEGCCNAIVEAMACGLPIISSNKGFNDDILNKSNSIKINPDSINEIVCAIKKLQSDKQLRSTLSEGSIKMAQNLIIEMRVNKIISFIEDCLNGNKYQA